MIAFVLAVFLLSPAAIAQAPFSDTERLASAHRAFDGGDWEEAARLARGPENQSPELDLLNGLSLARLEKWPDAKLALEAGLRKAPRDARFPVELAGVAYKQKDFRTAKRRLHAALRLNPQDTYSREFLATLYYLEGNLEAALKYWNPEDKPRLRSVAFAPPPQLKETLRERAIVFNAPQVLSGEALLAAKARLENLGVFSNPRIELASSESGSYDLTWHAVERNGWGESKVEGIASLLSGVPYATVYPEVFNLGHKAVNLTALGRWDKEKRRAFATLSMPLEGNPGRRLRLYADARNENWNLTQTLLGAGTDLSDINLRRIAAGAESRSLVNGRWSWSAGAEMTNRSFRNVPASLSSGERTFFTRSNSLSAWLAAEGSLVRVPERRFTLDGSVEAKAGREFAQALGPFARLRSSLQARWFPRASGDDYEMNMKVRAGGTAGKETLDELFQLGVERDNDLWLRGHAGTAGGRKGAALMGRRYLLANWELDKNIYGNGLFGLKLGPFVDSGVIADSSGILGSRQWLWDSGVQCKVRILGGITAVFSYGRDLRGNSGVFYGTVLRAP